MKKLGRKQRGFLLIGTALLGLLVLSSIGIWFRKIQVQSHLAQRLIQQRSVYVECQSLFSVVRENVSQLSAEEKSWEEAGFMEIEEEGEVRWILDRSSVRDKKVTITFHLQDSSLDPLVFALIIP